MGFSILHWLPSAIAAVLVILLYFVRQKPYHKMLAYAMVFFALLGLIGFLASGSFSVFALDPHGLHAWLGTAALVLSLYAFSKAAFTKKKKITPPHHFTGTLAGITAAFSLLLGVLMLAGFTNVPPGEQVLVPQTPVPGILPEVEATEFEGVQLTPLSSQRNNAIQGTQRIGRESYRLEISGRVESPGNFTYGELLALPAYSEVTYMPCVEGWGFTAKWTGFRVADLLDRVRLKPDATYVVFRSSDGYSTGLPISYIRENQVLMAYGINDVTLPPERGFPFQVVAKSKYGYKWAKWIVKMEVGDEEVRGYWESRGYSNSANVGEPPFG